MELCKIAISDSLQLVIEEDYSLEYMPVWRDEGRSGPGVIGLLEGFPHGHSSFLVGILGDNDDLQHRMVST